MKRYMIWVDLIIIAMAIFILVGGVRGQNGVSIFAGIALMVLTGISLFKEYKKRQAKRE